MELIVTCPVEPETVILVPATIEVTIPVRVAILSHLTPEPVESNRELAVPT